MMMIPMLALAIIEMVSADRFALITKIWHVYNYVDHLNESLIPVPRDFSNRQVQH
jgi:hypothetical protein